MFSCKIYVFFFVSFFLNIENWSEAQSPTLECYTCVSLPGDLTCLNDPENVSGSKVSKCENGWCTIYRQEMIDNPGEIVSFLRGCEFKEPLYLDDVIPDAHHVTYIRTCRANRCNAGDGLRSLGSGGGVNGSGEFIIVQADRSSSIKVAPIMLSFVSSALFYIMLWS